MTEPGGGVVVAEVHRCAPLAEWQKAALEVLRRLEGRLPVKVPMRRHTVEQYEHPSPFRQTKIFTHRWTQRRTIDQTVEGILTALCPYFRKHSVEKVLRSTLREAVPSDNLEEQLRLTAVFAQETSPD